ncbi:MAG: mitochondrial fission ELM1 family protein [Thiotrichales bacterium]|nr:mitochondrial fission ELM1 family protein [Thiotrichales bacterium]
MTDRNAICIWRFCDGKPGHDKQTDGLSRALRKIIPGEIISMSCWPALPALFNFLLKRLPGGATPAPDLILGAGHATHISLLTAARATGARCVVLMKPSMPLAWFDACLVPEHDQVAESARVIHTRGAINTLSADQPKSPHSGLLLLGGPSKHFDWDNTQVVRQLAEVIEHSPRTRWQLVPSRRSPAALLAHMQRLESDQVRLVTYEQCPPGWLDSELQRCATAWVSADSISMICEAVTAGCRTGVFQPGKPRHAKAGRAIQGLMTDKLITDFNDWQQGRELPPPGTVLNEADRCARVLCEKFFSDWL